MSPFKTLIIGLAAFSLPRFSIAGSSASDPCATVGGKTYAPPADVIACQKSFPFNETLRQNVLNNIARVLDFFTFEDFYLNSPPPFEESTTDIRADLARINSTTYEVFLWPSCGYDWLILTSV